MDNWLTAILDCGSMDLKLLGGFGYNPSEIIEDIRDNGDAVTLESIFGEVSERALSDLEESVFARIVELKELGNDRTEDKEEEYDAISSLDPRGDIEIDFNYMASSAGFINNGDIYRKYFTEAINDFEENLGLSL